MTTNPAGREFVRFAVPSILGMLAVSSAGMVDGIFVGNHVGADALASVNLVMPVFSLLYGIIVMLTMGSAVIAGKYIGEGRGHLASDVFSKTLIAVFSLMALISAVTLVMPESVAQLLGARDEILQSTALYLVGIGAFFPAFATAVIFSHFARVDGRPNFALIGMLVVTGSNILMDALFIAVFGWGLWGAALATGLASLIGSFFLVTHYFRKASLLHFQKPRGSWLLLARAAFNGLSEFINEMSGGLVIFLFNWILMTGLGAVGVAAFTVFNYIFYFGLFVFYGVGEGLSPLVSVNFGAGKARRIFSFLKLGVVVNFLGGVLLAAILLIWPHELAGIFLQDGDQETLNLTVQIVSLTWPLFLFNGVNIAFSAYFTGMQRARESVMIALSRSLVLPLTLMLILWQTFGTDGLFMALPLAEVLTFGLCLIFFWLQPPHRVMARVRA